MGVSFGNAIGIVSSTAANPTVPISFFFLFFLHFVFLLPLVHANAHKKGGGGGYCSVTGR